MATGRIIHFKELTQRSVFVYREDKNRIQDAIEHEAGMGFRFGDGFIGRLNRLLRFLGFGDVDCCRNRIWQPVEVNRLSRTQAHSDVAVSPAKAVLETRDPAVATE